jgi:hypothetical protein
LENEGYDKDVIHREGELDDIAGDEFVALDRGPVLGHARRDQEGENKCEDEPGGAPGQGLLELNLVRFPVENAEVQQQKDNDCRDEDGPVPSCNAQAH